MPIYRFARWTRLGAFICLCLAIVFNPRDAGAHADLLLQVEEYTKQIAKEPNNIDLFVRRGELYRAHLDWDLALADFDHILAIEPANQNVDFLKGRLMADANWLLSAKAHLDRFLLNHSNHAEAFNSRARVETRLNLHMAAARDYDAAIRLSPEPGPEMFIERAQTLAAQGPEDLEKALASLDEGTKRIGPLVTLQLLAIDLELKRTNYSAAIERVDRIAERSPRKETWLARRAEILQQAGRPQEARDAYQSALLALNTLPAVRRNVPAMAELEKRIRSQLDAINATLPSVK